MDEQLAGLEKEVNQKRAVLLQKMEALSKKRKAAAPEIEKQLMERLSYLRMPNTRFRCEFTTKKNPMRPAEIRCSLFSANKNNPLQPVADIASGRDISIDALPKSDDRGLPHYRLSSLTRLIPEPRERWPIGWAPS